MSVDQGRKPTTRSQQANGAVRTEALRERYDQATAALDPPLALVDLAAFARSYRSRRASAREVPPACRVRGASLRP